MAITNRPRCEAYPFGGPGTFILGNVRHLHDELLSRYAGKVDLIYLDPPFGTGDEFSVKLSSAGEKLKIPTYSDTMGTADYLDMMRQVLCLCRELLSDRGSVYLHIDYRMGAKLRLVMDDIFGESCFQNEIIWAYKSGGRAVKHFSRKHDTILFYKKTKAVYFNISAVGVPRGPMRRNNMKRFVDENGKLCFSIRSGGKTYTYYEDTPVFPTDVWCDIEHMHQRDPERTGYASQKPEALLRRIILASCPEDGLVADLFCGSGTTAAVAAKLGRRFLAVDASPAAMGVVRNRLLADSREASLLNPASSVAPKLTIEYSALPQSSLTAEFSLERKSGSLFVELTDVSSKFGLSFMSLGFVECGAFRPLSYTLSPALGYKLADHTGKSTVLQLCDHAGGMKFFEL